MNLQLLQACIIFSLKYISWVLYTLEIVFSLDSHTCQNATSLTFSWSFLKSSFEVCWSWLCWDGHRWSILLYCLLTEQSPLIQLHYWESNCWWLCDFSFSWSLLLDVQILQCLISVHATKTQLALVLFLTLIDLLTLLSMVLNSIIEPARAGPDLFMNMAIKSHQWS